MTLFTKHVFYKLLLTKPSTWRNDADDGGDGGDGAPTTLATWPSPFLNARRDKISRAGKPLTLMNTEIIKARKCVLFLHEVTATPEFPYNRIFT